LGAGGSRTGARLAEQSGSFLSSEFVRRFLDVGGESD
jgi:hypothetical protein